MTRLMAALALLAAMVVAAPATAQDLPPGKWWQRPELAQRLGLTQEQQDRLDELFRRTAKDLIDLKAEVDKASIELRSSLDRDQIDRNTVQRSAAAVSEARGRLFQREVMMLVDMRAVLDEEQWSRFRRVMEMREAHERNRRNQQRRPPQRKRPQ